jgi:hypothetical protein
MIPRVNFEVSRDLNLFCHVSVLFSDIMPRALAEGVLGNPRYQEEHAGFKNEEVRQEILKNGLHLDEREWFRFARLLMRADSSKGAPNMEGGFAEMMRRIESHDGAGFEPVWRVVRPQLEEYRAKLEAEWSPISDRVLSRLSTLTKESWQTTDIRVHLIDSINGGFAWQDCIGMAAFPELEVEKKLLTHELSELITPQRLVALAARREGLDQGIVHTVVDSIAYFSVKNFLVNLERKGIKPNPSYYPEVDKLLPMFERYDEDPSAYPAFTSLVDEAISTLKKP